ncbi:Rieske 2Fe-2S domain-containing protein [bacterium]|nr:Rieske 2Fe-2S domain-containing protein [bacterium]
MLQPTIKFSALEEGKLIRFESEDEDLVLCRVGDKVYAFENQCSHMEVKLHSGALEGTVVTCKAHGAKFDVCTGKALCMPAVKGIKTYSTKIIDDLVYVELE